MYWQASPSTATLIAAETLNQMTYGWTPIPYTLTYASATTVTISGNVTAYFIKGMKIKLTQTTVKYFVVISSSYSAPNTTITLHPYDSTTSVANAAITAPYYSFMDSPMGFPEKPKARAYLGTNQNNLTDTTYTKVLLDTETYDVGANFASYKFTAPVSGYYSINGNVMYTGVIATKVYVVRLYYNNTTSIAEDWKHSSVASSILATTKTIQFLNKGDFIELVAYVSTGANTVDVLAGTQYTYLEVALLHV